jgi:3-methyladenine DNA glycosylase AlkD
MDPHHKDIHLLILSAAGTPTQHTFQDNYLGNKNPRYAINMPRLRMIAKDWMKAHRDLSPAVFAELIGSMVSGKSSTEKVMAGILLDNATPSQRKFDPRLFEKWLDHLTGWAEIDAVCTGRYCDAEIPSNMVGWQKILTRLSKSSNINKRRAALVFLCSPVSHHDDPRLAKLSIQLINKLKGEHEVIITRAISWLLRSMVRYHSKALVAYLTKHGSSLPSVALRETRVKLATGRKSGTKGTKRK